jgi:tRNA modification GTPase
MTDTIFALSSGHGKAGIAVIRASGRGVRGLLGRIARAAEFPPRRAVLADLTDMDGALIDRAIVIYFQAPNSFTGEDVAEFHAHGSAAVVEKIFGALRGAGARMANAGEFARRAFQNGKMGLIEAEGLAALLDARTGRQLNAALHAATGAAAGTYARWRADMVEIAAYAAAMLDYPADELPGGIGAAIASRIRKLYADLSAHLARAGAVRAVRGGFNIVIAGPVNAGKSSLFNRLAGEARAIVSDIPGTTREIVSAELDMDGYLVRLLDTAGLRDTADAVEKIGVARAVDAARDADLVLRLESEGPSAAPNGSGNEIVVYNKCDLGRGRRPCAGKSARVSALTGEGIAELLEIIRKELHARLDGAESDAAVNARTKALLEEAAAELKKSLELGFGVFDGEGDRTAPRQIPNLDLPAEHVRRAADAIGHVLGEIGAAEVADKVFGQLCLGK